MHDLAVVITPITVPKWGLSMEEGVVVEWHVQEGDKVEFGQELLDIETSKIVNAVESNQTGVFRRAVEDAGATVLVGQLIGVIADESVTDDEVDAYVEEFTKSYVPPELEDNEESNTKFLDISGNRFHYTSVEHEDNKNLTILLIHGFGGDCNNWMFNIGELAKEHTVYALDLPGHGGSSKVIDDGSLNQLATAVLEFMDAMGLVVAHVIGHSLGAAVAMEVAKIQAGRVASLGLLAPCGLGEKINNDYVRGFIDGQSRRELKQTLGLLFADKSLVSRDMVDDVLKYKRTDGVTAALGKIAESVFPSGIQKHNFRDLLNSLQSLSISIIWGDLDEISDPKHSEGLHESIEITMIEGIGHMPHMEAASEVNKLLLAHVSRMG